MLRRAAQSGWCFRFDLAKLCGMILRDVRVTDKALR